MQRAEYAGAVGMAVGVGEAVSEFRIFVYGCMYVYLRYIHMYKCKYM